MTMNRLATSAAVAALATVSMAACSSSRATSTTTAAAAKPAAAATTAAAAKPAGKKLSIGVSVADQKSLFYIAAVDASRVRTRC